MSSPLAALAGIISQSVQTLESAYSKKGLSFPSLDEPFKPGPLDDDPDVGNTTRLIVAAACQIIATVRPPLETIMLHAPAMYMSASLGVVDEANIADVLKDAGSQVREWCRTLRGNLNLAQDLTDISCFNLLGPACERHWRQNWCRLRQTLYGVFLNLIRAIKSPLPLSTQPVSFGTLPLGMSSPRCLQMYTRITEFHLSSLKQNRSRNSRKSTCITTTSLLYSF